MKLKITFVAATLSSLVTGCYSRPSTLGQNCGAVLSCDAGQYCDSGVCAQGSAAEEGSTSSSGETQASGDSDTDVSTEVTSSGDGDGDTESETESSTETGDGDGDGDGDTGGPMCGNGIKEGMENCDGDDFGGDSCSDHGAFTGGSLMCTSMCDLDITGCCNGAGSACGLAEGPCCNGLTCGLLLVGKCG